MHLTLAHKHFVGVLDLTQLVSCRGEWSDVRLGGVASWGGVARCQVEGVGGSGQMGVGQAKKRGGANKAIRPDFFCST